MRSLQRSAALIFTVALNTSDVHKAYACCHLAETKLQVLLKVSAWSSIFACQEGAKASVATINSLVNAVTYAVAACVH